MFVKYYRNIYVIKENRWRKVNFQYRDRGGEMLIVSIIPNKILYITEYVRKIFMLYSLFELHKCETSTLKSTRKGQWGGTSSKYPKTPLEQGRKSPSWAVGETTCHDHNPYSHSISPCSSAGGKEVELGRRLGWGEGAP